LFRSRQRIVVVPGVLLGRREPQGPRESSGQSGQRVNGLVQGQFRMGAEPVVREDNGAVGVRGIFDGRVVRHDDHPGRTAEEETVQTRLVLHRVLRQRRFLFQRIPVQNPGTNLLAPYETTFTCKSTMVRAFHNWVYMSSRFNQFKVRIG